MKRITFLKKGISLVCAILMLTAVLPTALAAEYTSDDCYVEGYDTSVEIVEEGAVLLKNANGILPLQDGAKVTLLGSMSYNYVFSMVVPFQMLRFSSLPFFSAHT